MLRSQSCSIPISGITTREMALGLAAYSHLMGSLKFLITKMDELSILITASSKGVSLKAPIRLPNSLARAMGS